MAANCPTTPGCHRVSAQAAAISAARPGVAHRLRAMPHTAWATTIFRPRTRPASNQPPAADENPSPSRARASAEGSVKPSHAASAPPQPARISPSARPTWLLAGPGRNWHSATRSA